MPATTARAEEVLHAASHLELQRPKNLRPPVRSAGCGSAEARPSGRSETGARVDAVAVGDVDRRLDDWRGSDISHRYRQLPVDSVPTDLDRLILEQARAAVGAPAPPRRTWIRWGLPLGLIGSAVLAATLVFDGARPPRQPSTAQTQISPTERPERADVLESSTARLPAGTSSPAPQPTLAPATQPRPVAPAIAPQRGESVPASVQISAPVAVSAPSQPQAAVVATLAPEPAAAAATVSELPLQAAPFSARLRPSHSSNLPAPLR